MNEYEEMGQKWLRGEIEIQEFNGIKLNPKQKEFINDKNRFSLVSGGMASGKTLGWQIKLILLTQWFPGCRILIGRKTKGNAISTFIKDFVDICPPGLYEHKVGEGKLVFTNKSEAIFFGLDALAGNSGDDLKKAEQDLKSHNFQFIFIDQLEEIQEKIFQSLNSRTRGRQCKHGTIEGKDVDIIRDENEDAVYEVCKTCGKYTFNQFCMTTNPGNYWGFDFFKGNPRKMTNLIETSMMDNKNNLPEQFIQSELQKPDLYVKKFVYGLWSKDLLSEGTVFSTDYITDQGFNLKEPLREYDGIKIFKEAEDIEYQIGVDPSEGAVDPSCVQVISEEGEQVAVFSGYVPTHALIEKVIILAEMYSTKKKVLIVPEATGIGQALIEHLKVRWENVYEREVFSQREKKSLKKLGFHTNFATKQQLIENMKELFQKKFPKIHDKETLEEFKTFVYSDEAQRKGAGAQNNYHDDRLMALLLAYWNRKPITIKEKDLLARVERSKRKPITYQYA